MTDVAGAVVVDERRRRALAIVAITVAVTAVLGVVVGMFFPAPDDDGRYSYAAVEPVRGFFRAWLVLAGVNLVVGITALALAGWRLAPARGSLAATLGAGLMWLGCAFYAVGLRGLSTAYYFGTDAAALDAGASARLLDHLHESTLALWGPAIAGAILVALGQILLAAGLWQARTVPRWVPALLATIPLTLVVETSGVGGLLVELPVALGALGVAGRLWQREVAPPGGEPRLV